jgi:hypothetical protein
MQAKTSGKHIATNSERGIVSNAPSLPLLGQFAKSEPTHPQLYREPI